MSARRRSLFALVVTLLLVLTACEVRLEVDIDVAEDGSGVVSVAVGVDDDAQRRLGDIDNALRTADLEATGWEISRPQIREDGRRWYEASKPFANPDQLQTVLDELAGPNTMFQDFTIVRESGDNETLLAVDGSVDLTEGVNVFSDGELGALLDDPPFGIPVADVEEQIGPLEQAVDLQVRITLPGESATTQVVELGERREISASSTQENQWGIVLTWVGYALLGLFVLSVVLAGAGFWLEHRYEDEDDEPRTPAPVRARVPAADMSAAASATGAAARSSNGRETAEPESEPEAPGTARLQLVVLGAAGAVFEGLEARERWLAGFARERGSVATDTEIIEAYRQAVAGRLTSAELWERLGVPGRTEDLDAAFLTPVRARPAAKEFFHEMRRRGVPVAVVSNDVSAWSHQLRAIHGLEQVDVWIVSSDVGAALPDPALFEAVRAQAGVPFSRALVVMTDLESLDVASSLGMITSLYAARRPEGAEVPRHPVVTSFNDFFRRRRAPEPVGGRRRRR